MWDALQEICAREESSVDRICGHVSNTNGEGGFTSGLRVFIVNYFRGHGGPVEPRPGGEEVARLAP